MWDTIKRWLGKPVAIAGMTSSEATQRHPPVIWIPAEKSKWHVPVADIRSITQGVVSGTSNPEFAMNAVSWSQEDGRSFIGELPPDSRAISANLRYRNDSHLADGVLFSPREMEHKWAIFYHDTRIIAVRSWTRRVQLVAETRLEDGFLHIESLLVAADPPGEDGDHLRCFDFLIRSHALGLIYPAPIPSGEWTDLNSMGMLCYSWFGNLAHFASSNVIPFEPPNESLRTDSLLHIGVAKSDSDLVRSQIAAGVPITILARDGLAPAHWALATDGTAMLQLLLELGSPVDVRSIEDATALMNAVQAGNQAAVELLIGRGADVNAVDHRGFTALHRGAEMGNKDLVIILLRHGANPNLNARGHTPRSLAVSQGHTEIDNLLR